MRATIAGKGPRKPLGVSYPELPVARLPLLLGGGHQPRVAVGEGRVREEHLADDRVVVWNGAPVDRSVDEFEESLHARSRRVPKSSGSTFR